MKPNEIFSELDIWNEKLKNPNTSEAERENAARKVAELNQRLIFTGSSAPLPTPVPVVQSESVTEEGSPAHTAAPPGV